MTGVLFAASVAFVGYTIYVLVGEQMGSAKKIIVDVQPEPLLAVVVEQPAPPPTSTRAKPVKAATKEVAIAVNVTESVGMAAGSTWNYLNENGSTSVAKLIRELPEDNKTLQRSIGWLAQEDKITLETVDRVEIIALKE